ncbi:MAG: hypothetical protein LQ342_001552 [Letrouitia transgressa]|nr:MAG: hypothetical protein LQ342_001552 [Letrouitia transgressa]
MNLESNSAHNINLLTLNCWGLKYIAKYRAQRLKEIGRSIALSRPQPEIVGLQECWTQEDYLAIRAQTRHILPHGKFYHSGIFGGGLAILSKWRIIESSMVRYPLNGRPTAFFRGDWFVGKGVACASIRIGPRREDVIEVFCTHLHAPYESGSNDSYVCHRTAQAWEIAKLIRGAAERRHLAIGLGDFNMVPLSLPYRLITAHAPVEDAWRVIHPDSSLGAAGEPSEKARGLAIPNAKYNLTENGATCDSALNTWRWNKQQRKQLAMGEDVSCDDSSPDPRAKRLDYIFFSNGTQTAPSQWRVQAVKVGMTNRHPVLKCSLSDHFSVEATLSRHHLLRPDPSSPTAATDESSIPASSNNKHTPFQSINNNSSLNPTLYTSYNPSPTSSLLPLPFARTPSPPTAAAAAAAPSIASSNSALPPETYHEILNMISTYETRELRQRRFRLTHFLISIVVSIICFIGIWWSNHAGISFMLVFISTIGLAAGLLDGLIGGFFINSELRALKEFEWEIRNAQEMAEKDSARERPRKERWGTGRKNSDGEKVRDSGDTPAVRVERELWEKVRGSREYGGNDNVPLDMRRMENGMI